MKKILKELKVSSRSSYELENLVFGTPNNSTNRRSLQNYLLELVNIETINYDPATGLYTFRENKQTFQSKADYDLALTHSHGIFFYEVGKGTDFEGENPYFYDEKIALLQLAFLEEDRKRGKEEEGEWDNENLSLKKQEENNPSNWHLTSERQTSLSDLGENSDFEYAQSYLLQHIRTGYPEIFELIEKYKQFLTKRGVTSGYVIHKSEGLIESVPGIPAIKVTEKEKQEFDDIVDLFVGKMRRLTRDVVDKIPLLGYCDGCPTSRITIKDRQEK